MAVQIETYEQEKYEKEETQSIRNNISRFERKNYRKATWLFKFLRILIGGLIRLVFNVKVSGLENLPKEGGYILAGNHLSWLDPFLLLVFSPAEPRVHFIAAKENMQKSTFRSYMTEQVGGVINVERGKGTGYLAIARQVSQVLRGGGVLGIFPEGTVSETETGQLLPFKKGVGHFARKSGCPIVPVVISGSKELWLRKKIVVKIGAPIEVSAGDTAETLTDKTCAAIKKDLPLYRDPGGLKLMRNFWTNLF